MDGLFGSVEIDAAATRRAGRLALIFEVLRATSESLLSVGAMLTRTETN